MKKLACDLNTELAPEQSQSAARIYAEFVKKEAPKKQPPKPRPAPSQDAGAPWASAPQAASARASDGGQKNARPYMRKARGMDGELTKIADLLPESEAIIEGDILSVETRLIRDGKDTLLTFGITDYTSSIKCKKFLKGTTDELLQVIKKGRAVQSARQIRLRRIRPGIHL